MTRASDILKEVSLFESFFRNDDAPVTYGVDKKLMEEKIKKDLSVYIEIDNGGKITRMEPEAFRKSVGGSHTGFAQDWVDKYNKDKGSKMARLVYAKNGKEIGKKVESIKERSSEAIKMKPDDEKKIALLKASLLNTPLVKKKEVTAQIDLIKAKYESRSLKTETADFIKGSIFEAGGWDSPTRKMAIATDHGMGDEVLKIVAEFKKKYPDSVEKIVKMPKMVVIKFKFRSVADSLGPVRELKNSLADIGVDRMMTKIESVMEGGPGSGGQYPTQKMKMPLSPFISVGTRKGILKNMPFEIETVPLSKITHVAQRKFVPFKVKNLCKSPDGISKKPICLLKVPSEDAYHVMDGHHRYLAAMKKGMDSLDAKVWIKFEEPKVEEPIAEEPPIANEIDLDAIPSGEPEVPAEAEAIDVTIDGKPASIEGAPAEEIPAMDTPPASNVTLDDAPLTATDPLLPVDAPLEDELDQPIEAMTLDQALESMDRCGKALMQLSESKKKVQSEKIKEISYSWEDGKHLAIFLDGLNDLALFTLTPVNRARIGEVINFIDKELAHIDWKKPIDEIKPEAGKAIKKIRSKLVMVDIAGVGPTLSKKGGGLRF